jgi:hypothetical protein
MSTCRHLALRFGLCFGESLLTVIYKTTRLVHGRVPLVDGRFVPSEFDKIRGTQEFLQMRALGVNQSRVIFGITQEFIGRLAWGRKIESTFNVASNDVAEIRIERRRLAASEISSRAKGF